MKKLSRKLIAAIAGVLIAIACIAATVFGANTYGTTEFPIRGTSFLFTITNEDGSTTQYTLEQIQASQTTDNPIVVRDGTPVDIEVLFGTTDQTLNMEDMIEIPLPEDSLGTAIAYISNTGNVKDNGVVVGTFTVYPGDPDATPAVAPKAVITITNQDYLDANDHKITGGGVSAHGTFTVTVDDLKEGEKKIESGDGEYVIPVGPTEEQENLDYALEKSAHLNNDGSITYTITVTNTNDEPTEAQKKQGFTGTLTNITLTDKITVKNLNGNTVTPIYKALNYKKNGGADYNNYNYSPSAVNATVQSYARIAASGSYAAETAYFTVPSLAIGETATFTYKLYPKETFTGTVRNDVVSKYNNDDSKTKTDNTETLIDKTLTLKKQLANTDGPYAPFVQDTDGSYYIDYTVTVTNPDSRPLTNVKVTDLFQVNTSNADRKPYSKNWGDITLIDRFVTSQGTATLDVAPSSTNAPKMTWTVGTLAGNATATFTYRVHFSADMLDGANVIRDFYNAATATADGIPARTTYCDAYLNQGFIKKTGTPSADNKVMSFKIVVNPKGNTEITENMRFADELSNTKVTYNGNIKVTVYEGTDTELTTPLTSTTFAPDDYSTSTPQGWTWPAEGTNVPYAGQYIYVFEYEVTAAPGYEDTPVGFSNTAGYGEGSMISFDHTTTWKGTILNGDVKLLDKDCLAVTTVADDGMVVGNGTNVGSLYYTANLFKYRLTINNAVSAGDKVSDSVTIKPALGNTSDKSFMGNGWRVFYLDENDDPVYLTTDRNYYYKDDAGNVQVIEKTTDDPDVSITFNSNKTAEFTVTFNKDVPRTPVYIDCAFGIYYSGSNGGTQEVTVTNKGTYTPVDGNKVTADVTNILTFKANIAKISTVSEYLLTDVQNAVTPNGTKITELTDPEGVDIKNGLAYYIVQLNANGNLEGNYIIQDILSSKSDTKDAATKAEIVSAKVYTLGDESDYGDTPPTISYTDVSYTDASGGKHPKWNILVEGLKKAELIDGTDGKESNSKNVVEILIAVKIDGDTQLAGGIIRNSAELFKEGSETSLGSDYEFYNVAEQSLSKESVYSGATAPYANYRIKFNDEKRNLAGITYAVDDDGKITVTDDGSSITLTDEMAAILTPVMSSVKFYDTATATVDTATGTVTGTEITSGTSASWNAATHTMTLVVPDEKAVTIAYQCTIDAAVGETVTLDNKVWWNEYPDTKVTTEDNVKITDPSSWTTGTPNFYIHKIDENQHSAGINGTKFQLYTVTLDTGGNIVMTAVGTEKTTETDSVAEVDGRIHYTDLDENTVYAFAEHITGIPGTGETEENTRKHDGTYYTADIASGEFGRIYFVQFKDHADIEAKIEKEYGTGSLVTIQNGVSLDVMNTKVRDISVTKVWHDNNNNAQLRPTSVTIALKADGQAAKDLDGNPIANVTLNGRETTPWTHTWTKLPANTSTGADIVYTVEEVSATGVQWKNFYSSAVTPTDSSGSTFTGAFTVTNTLNVVPTDYEIPVGKLLEIPDGLTGPDITKKFTFTLTAAGNTAGIPLQEMPMPKVTSYTNPDPNGGNMAFGPITYNAPGTYEYTITESGNVAGVTNDTGKKKVIVTVSEPAQGSTDGKFVITAADGDGNAITENAPVKFTNKYSASGTIQLAATKKFEGAYVWDDKTYTFALKDAEGTIESKDVTKANPVATFTELSYSAEGTYEYTITETTTLPDGVTKTGDISVTVTVTDNKAGTLTTAAVYKVGGQETTDPSITNKYSASGTANLQVTKKLEGRDWLDGDEFTFVLKQGETEIESVKATKADPVANFTEISYTATGTHTYTIDETGTLPDSVQKQNGPITATVEVTDPNHDGQLVTAVTYTDAQGTAINDPAITNKYTASGSAKLNAKKVLTGRDWLDGEKFTFTLKDADGDEIESKEVSEDSQDVTFTALTYTEADAGKDYTYTIVETSAKPDGITVSDPITATVKVRDTTHDGNLTTTIEYDPRDFTITNTYSASGTANLQVTKKLEGRDWLDGDEFTFVLKQGETEIESVKATKADPVANFTALSYTATGTHTYTIDETGTLPTSVQKLDGPITATVEVTDPNHDGQLVTAVTYTDAQGTAINDPAITNKYTASGTAELKAKKVLTGRDWLEGEKFTFTLKDADGDKIESKEVSKDSQDVTFTVLNYTEADAGKEYTYTIEETSETPAGITVSGPITAKVAVTDPDHNGRLTTTVTYTPSTDTITNTYNASGKVTLEAIKNLVGREWLEGETYTFTLYDKDDTTVLGERTVTKNEKVKFDQITYTEADAGKEYTYRISETSTLPGGITKSGDITATVKISQAGGSELSTTVQYSNSDTITNTYTVEPLPVTAKVKKVLSVPEGQAAPDITRKFKFTFAAVSNDAGYAVSAMPMPAVKEKTNLDANGGEITFSDITFEKPGEYVYSVTESNAGDPVPGVTNDTTATREVKITVTDNKDGTMSAVVDPDLVEFTNKYDQGETKITVVKTWDDFGDQDGLRPDKIEVVVTGKAVVNGKEETAYTETLTVNGPENCEDQKTWSVEIEHLPKWYKGSEIKYTTTEKPIESYTMTGEELKPEDKTYKYTNEHEPEVIAIEGEKIWDDDDDRDGLRPESITVRLVREDGKPARHQPANEGETGAPVDPITVTADADGNWYFCFRNLPKYENHGQEIEYKVEEDAIEQYTTFIEDQDHVYFVITNKHEPEPTSFKVLKIWDDVNDRLGLRAASVDMDLLADGEPAIYLNYDETETATLSEDNNWGYTWENLPKFRDHGVEIIYTVDETNIPDGYRIRTATESDATPVATGSDADEASPSNATIGYVYNITKVGDLSIHKAINGKDTPDDDTYNFTVTLLDDGAAADITAEFYTAYSVKDGADQPGTIQFTDGVSDTITLGADDELRIIGLPDGIGYKVEEADKSGNGFGIGRALFGAGDDYYEPVIFNGEGTIASERITYVTFINRKDKKTSIVVEKEWDDDDNRDNLRPLTLTYQLIKVETADGEDPVETIVDTVEVTEKDGWGYMWEDLDLVSEATGSNAYVTYEDGTTQSNASAADAAYAEEADKASTSVASFSDASASDAFDEEGELLDGTVFDDLVHVVEDTVKSIGRLFGIDDEITVTYRVEEINVPDRYTAEVEETDENTFLVTNRFDKKYKKTQVQVSKTWDDDSDRDGIRPDKLTVNLLADGEKVATAELNEANKWSYTFKDLYQNARGTAIVYTVEEVIPGQYEGSIELVEDGPDNWFFKLLNKYLPKKTSYKATKVWDDSDNKWSKRPTSVAVQLLADGEKVGDPVVLNADNNWTCTWKDLYVNSAKGKAIVYTAIEVEVPASYTVYYEHKTGETVITNYYRKYGGGGGGGGGKGGNPPREVPPTTPPVPETPMAPATPGRLPKTGLPFGAAVPFLAAVLAAAGALFGFSRRNKDDDEQ